MAKRKKNPVNVARGELVAKYRERHGETQAQLAEAVGKERVTVNAYENGDSGMPIYVREAIVKRYGVPPADLGLDIDRVETTTGKGNTAAKQLALHVLKTSEDPEAKRLALEYLEQALAIKI